jgi:hypothetical protein
MPNVKPAGTNKFGYILLISPVLYPLMGIALAIAFTVIMAMKNTICKSAITLLFLNIYNL